MPKEFHNRPYEEGSLAKLQIFELYTQEWIPVFLVKPEPPFKEVHIFDFFSGPGSDSSGTPGSPLRILAQLRNYHEKGLAGWDKTRIVVHLFDEDQAKTQELASKLNAADWKIQGVEIDCRALVFRDALQEHDRLLSDSRVAKLLIIDQYGVDEVSDPVFRRLVGFPTADFIFFLSSSTLHRFRDHPAIKQKIERPEDSYDVHRAAVRYYRNLVPPDQIFLGSFSIRKRSNIYGLVFGSHHPLGIHKFLQVAWKNDELAGEANFDINRDNIRPEEGILDLDVMRPHKVRDFEDRLEAALRAGRFKSEADVVRFCIEEGMTTQHSAGVFKKLKHQKVIFMDFRVPEVGRFRNPRAIKMP